MTLILNASNAYLSGTIDLTATPQILLTNSSTYTPASALAAVEAEEVSGSGYARANLTVQSNSINPGGDSVLIYNLATIAASGGNIVFDRAVLVADGDWVGYWDYGSTTIANGQVKPFRGITIARSDSGAVVNGANGDPAYTNTTTDFTQPAVGATVVVSVTQSNFLAQGSVILINDGTNLGAYEVTIVGSPQSITVQRIAKGGSATSGTTIASGALVVVSGPTGENGADFALETFTGSPSAYTPTNSGQIAVRTDTTPDLAYRTTGTSIGNLTLLGSFATFTGDPAAYTPTDAGLLHVATDTTPNKLYRSTGTSIGNLTEIGSSGGAGYFFQYTLQLGVTNAAAGELGADGTINGGTSDPITALYIHETEGLLSADISTILDSIAPVSFLKLTGRTSGVTAYYSVTSTVDLGDYRTWGVSLIGTDGDFSDAETVDIQILPSQNQPYSTKTGNFTASSLISTRYFVSISANATVTLPLSASSVGINHLIKRVDNTAFTLTIARSGSDLIDGETSQTLAPYEAVSVHSDGGTNWWLT